MTPGPKFSSSTSAVFSSARKTSLPRGAFRSIGRLRLLALKATKKRLSASARSFRRCRAGSPLPGSSTLMTSAPSHASIWPHDGPAWLLVRSTTRMPASAFPIALECHQSRKEAPPMAVTLRQVGPCFAAEVDGLDLTRPLTPEEVAAVHAGMDRYAVLVFHDQQLDDEQQLAFTRSLGDIEHAIGTGLREQYRLPTTFADVSNLDVNNQAFARASRTRLFSLGNRLWHSDSSFK